MLKKCCKCKIEKPHDEFYTNKRSSDGLNSFCIMCHKADNILRKRINRANPDFRTVEAAKKKAGLHTPHNLRVIPTTTNRSKGNRLQELDHA